MPRRRIVLVQLPIPQPGLEPAVGNVPLAAAYLKLYAERQGWGAEFDIEIFPARGANLLGDTALVAALAERRPDLVGFSCYLWNVERSLRVAERLKQVLPQVRILVGGPEITADNAWVLTHPAVDWAALGEGERTFAELLAAWQAGEVPPGIPGLYVAPPAPREGVRGLGALPVFRRPLERLDEVSSPYRAGILDAADERLLLLETVRGCVFKCKFCYYPKSYDELHFLGPDEVRATLGYARERGVTEVVLLDPTLNQRRDFAELLELLAACNPEGQFTYFGELRAEGITPDLARRMRAAHFREVEIGLQTIDSRAQELMDRKNHLRAFERGVRALREAGIRVKTDLIIGLPGDTAASIRASFQYLRGSGLYDAVQVFNLAVLPGTAFRHEAESLGLVYQPRPPYYVLETPTLALPDLYELMAEAEEVFETEFDPMPPPGLPTETVVHVPGFPPLCRVWHVDLDAVAEGAEPPLPPAERTAQACVLWLRSGAWPRGAAVGGRLIRAWLARDPHATLQVVLEPTGDPLQITVGVLERLRQACWETTSYLDRFYGLAPGRTKGAKSFVVWLPGGRREALPEGWRETVGTRADLVWHGGNLSADELPEYEFVAEGTG